jgi:hypothetical protein
VLWGMTYYPRLPGAEDGTFRAKWIVDNERSVNNGGGPLWRDVIFMMPDSTRIPDETEEQILAQRRLILANEQVPMRERLEQYWGSRMGESELYTGLQQISMKLAEASHRKEVEATADKAVAAAQLNHSIAGRLGHFVEPVFRPLGFDWKMDIGLIGAFAAREVFVSTIAITYAAGDKDNTADLAAAMRADTYPDGRPVWTTPVALSLLVWFVLAMQCMSTIAIVRRETGGWRWPVFMLVYMNALAYGVSLVVYQVAVRMG